MKLRFKLLIVIVIKEKILKRFFGKYVFPVSFDVINDVTRITLRSYPYRVVNLLPDVMIQKENSGVDGLLNCLVMVVFNYTYNLISMPFFARHEPNILVNCRFDRTIP